MRIIALSSVLLFLTLLVATAERIKAEDREILLGGIFDISGAGAAWGVSEKRGFELAISDRQKSNPGSRIRYIIEDSAYSNTKAVSAFQKLTSVDGVKFIVGPTWEPFEAVLPLCESRKIVCLSPSYSSHSFDQTTTKYSFSLWFDNDDYSKLIAEQINQIKDSSVALVSTISPYYDGLVDQLLTNLNLKPNTVERCNPSERDYRSVIGRIPKTIDSLVLFLLGDGGFQAFIRQWTELRTDRPTIYSDDAVLYLSPAIDLDTQGFKLFYSAPDLTVLNSSGFNQRYLERFGEEPKSPSAAIAYDATRLLLDCIAADPKSSVEVSSCITRVSAHHGQSGIISFAGGNRVKTRRMVLGSLEKQKKNPN